MGDMSSGEAARAGREARDSVVSRPRGSKGSAIDAALRRYLGAEQYDELHRGERTQPKRSGTAKKDATKTGKKSAKQDPTQGVDEP